MAFNLDKPLRTLLIEKECGSSALLMYCLDRKVASSFHATSKRGSKSRTSEAPKVANVSSVPRIQNMSYLVNYTNLI